MIKMFLEVQVIWNNIVTGEKSVWAKMQVDKYSEWGLQMLCYDCFISM